MTDHELTHERCSELLTDFAAGRLDAAETTRVESHVRACPDCAAELGAIMALRAGDEPLTDMERARLRRNISASLGDVIAPAKEPSRFGSRIATALGAAALLAMFGVAIVSLGSSGTDEADSGPAARVADGDAPGDDQVSAESGAGGEAATAPRPRPTFDDDAGRLSEGKARKTGARERVLTQFGSVYSADDAEQLKDEYLSDLASQATEPVSSQIVSCAEEVYQAQPYALLPAYGARGKFDGRDALILGFVWTEKNSGPLDKFMLWTWSASSCDQPIDYRAGEIAPRR